MACFEPFYADGIRAYFGLVREAKDAGLIVIGDVAGLADSGAVADLASAPLRALAS